MPNIISQRITDKEIYIKATNGKEITISRPQLATHFLTEIGSVDSKKTQTIDWMKSEIQKALGAEMIDTGSIEIDMDSTQSPTTLTIGEK